MAEGQLKYDAALKRWILEEVEAGEEAVAAIARRWGLNVNMVHGWCRDPRYAAPVAPTFLPVTVEDDKAVPEAVLATVPAEPRSLNINLGERVRLQCLEGIAEATLARVVRILGQAA
jgi:transposase-like protein